MKKIKLNKGKSALVSDKDFGNIGKFNWFVTDSGYASRVTSRKNGHKNILMHREIIKAKQKQIVDHINMDRLDNRRENLRISNRSQNMLNGSKTRANTSGLRGISWSKKLSKWHASIRTNGVWKHLGFFTSKKDAKNAYEKERGKFI